MMGPWRNWLTPNSHVENGVEEIEAGSRERSSIGRARDLRSRCCRFKSGHSHEGGRWIRAVVLTISILFAAGCGPGEPKRTTIVHIETINGDTLSVAGHLHTSDEWLRCTRNQTGTVLAIARPRVRRAWVTIQEIDE